VRAETPEGESQGLRKRAQAFFADVSRSNARMKRLNPYRVQGRTETCRGSFELAREYAGCRMTPRVIKGLREIIASVGRLISSGARQNPAYVLPIMIKTPCFTRGVLA
jgi:hypothetical protein